MQSNLKSEFIVDAFASIPKNLDSSNVRTAAEYRILLHLVRPLLKYNKIAQLEGDLAESWTISEDHRIYEFTLRKDAKWSDGNLITPEEFCSTIRHHIRLNQAIHFDFSSVLAVAPIANNGVRIELKAPNFHLLTSLTHPEFGVAKTKLVSGVIQPDFTITSGPYFLEKKSPGESVVLVKNEFYTNHHPKGPKRVVFQSSHVKSQLEKLKKGEVDFVVPSGILTSTDRLDLLALSNVQEFSPQVGYSYWLSLNPSSKIFKNVNYRLWFLNAIRNIELDFKDVNPFWTRADQLYLPDGYGRPSANRIENEWATVSFSSSLSAPKSLKLVLSENFVWTNDIVNGLKSKGVEVKVELYKTSKEVSDFISKRDFDAILVNNDFSDAHLVENLVVAFNPARPLIFTDEFPEIRNELERALKTAEMSEHLEISKFIGIELLRNGLVAPLAYNRKIYYFKKGIDLSRWTSLQNDLGFWKVGLEEEWMK